MKGNLKIGRQKFYEPIIYGGLGLLNITDFLASQCCAWVRRSVNLDELWKRELFSLSYGSVFNIRKKEFCPTRNPI